MSEGLEVGEAEMHGLGTGRLLAGVARPAAEPGDDPGGPGEAVGGMRVELLDGPAGQLALDRSEGAYLAGGEGIADGLAGRAVAGEREVIDDTALFAFAHPKLVSYEALCQAGGGDADLVWLEAQVARVRPGQPAFIVYTSGTTGHPKGALIAHGKHLAATRSVAAQYPTLVEKEHRTVAYLPLCHVLGRDVAVTLPLMTQMVPHIGESAEDLPETLFETAPTVLFTVPRYLQKLAAQVLVQAGNSSAPKRFAFDRAMAFGRRHVKRRWTGAAGGASALAHAAWRAAVFRPVLSKIGFDALELVVSGGAPLPAETMAVWHMLGVNVCEMYGQTETAGGIVAGQRGPFPRPGDVGTVPEGFEVRLADDGEILVRSPDLFEGYWSKAGPSAVCAPPASWPPLSATRCG